MASHPHRLLREEADEFCHAWRSQAAQRAEAKEPERAHQVGEGAPHHDRDDARHSGRAQEEQAEREEQISYGGRMPEDWLEALRPIGTDEHQPYLETVPYLVILFAETQGVTEEGEKQKNYYVTESVGIAAGLFISDRLDILLLTSWYPWGWGPGARLFI